MADQQATRGPVPPWVDEIVEVLAAEFTVASGPAGIVLLGKREMGGLTWRNAREMDLGISGARAEYEPQLPALFTRLRSKATVQLESASMHPRSLAGEVTREGRDWSYIAPDHSVTRLGTSSDWSFVSLSSAGAYATTYSENPTHGAWSRIIGSLEEGELAYSPVNGDSLNFALECSPGGERDVMLVVQKQGGLSVVGFRVIRPLDNRTPTTFAHLGSRYRRFKFFALMNHEKGREKPRVLRIPND